MGKRKRTMEEEEKEGKRERGEERRNRKRREEVGEGVDETGEGRGRRERRWKGKKRM